MKSFIFYILAFISFEAMTHEEVDPLTLSMKERREYTFKLKQIYEEELMQGFSEKQKELVLDFKKRMNGELGLHQFSAGEGEKDIILVFISGAPRSGEDSPLTEWFKPLIDNYETGYKIFGHRLEGSIKLEENSHQIAKSIEKIKLKEMGKKIIVFGHSAGGTVMLHMKNKYFQQDDCIEVHTIGSPIFGYGYPSPPKLMTDLESSFFISSFLKLELGGNLVKKYGIKNPGQCFHHITTECSQDISACNFDVFFSGGRRRTKFGKIIKIPKDEINPQVFNIIEAGKPVNLESMPCGEMNTYEYANENHFTIVGKAIDDVISSKEIDS